METPMRRESGITHILFDFFGTLVEYTASYTDQGYPRSYQLLREEGSALDYETFLARWAATCSAFDRRADASLDECSMESIVEAFLSEVLARTPTENFVAAFRDSYIREWNKGVRYIDEVPSLLERLAQRYRLAVVSNTHSAKAVQDHLRAMGVGPYFSAIVTSIEFGRRKPDPSIFAHALNLTGGSPEAAIHVGDSFVADYLGASRAGLSCLLIDPEKKESVPSPERIDHVLQLADLL
jgi:putative hydrolase of the HAD superfamily